MKIHVVYSELDSLFFKNDLGWLSKILTSGATTIEGYMYHELQVLTSRYVCMCTCVLKWVESRHTFGKHCNWQAGSAWRSALFIWLPPKPSLHIAPHLTSFHARAKWT